MGAGDVFARRPDPIGRFVTVSGVLHGAAVLVMLAGAWWTADDAPLVDPDDVMMVTMALPKSPDALPHRAERAPTPAAPAPEAPPPEPEPVAPDPSELTFEEEEAEPTPKPPDGPTPEELEARRRRLMEMLDDEPPAEAPLGETNRSASSPDGTEGAAGAGGPVVGDPEYAAYISRVRALFHDAFRPLPALTGQGLVTRVFLRTNASGAVVESRVSQPSGNPSWDQAALTAVRSVPTVPLPPERFRDRLASGYTIEFSDAP